MKKIAAISCIAIIVLLSATLSFATSFDLFSTGVNANGDLTGIGTADSHYTLLNPAGNTVTAKSAGKELAPMFGQVGGRNKVESLHGYAASLSAGPA